METQTIARSALSPLVAWRPAWGNHCSQSKVLVTQSRVYFNIILLSGPTKIGLQFMYYCLNGPYSVKTDVVTRHCVVPENILTLPT